MDSIGRALLTSAAFHGVALSALGPSGAPQIGEQLAGSTGPSEDAADGPTDPVSVAERLTCGLLDKPSTNWGRESRRKLEHMLEQKLLAPLIQDALATSDPLLGGMKLTAIQLTRGVQSQAVRIIEQSRPIPGAMSPERVAEHEAGIRQWMAMTDRLLKVTKEIRAFGDSASAVGQAPPGSPDERSGNDTKPSPQADAA
jgi:hypothetical protein